MIARTFVGPLAVAIAAACLIALPGSIHAAAPAPKTVAATGWTLIKFPQGQPACTGVGWPSGHYTRLECGFGYVSVTGTTLTGTPSVVKVGFFDRSGNQLASQTTTVRTTSGSQGWQFTIQPASTWPAGQVTIRVTDVDPDGVGPAANQSGNFGETSFQLNALGASIAPGPGDHKPGQAIAFNGTLSEIRQVGPLASATTVGVPGTASVQVRTPDGSVRGPYGPYTADLNGKFSGTLPAAATAGVTATAEQGFKTTVSLEVVTPRTTTRRPASGRPHAPDRARCRSSCSRTRCCSRTRSSRTSAG